VYVSFADHEFEAGRVGDALTLYEKVIEGFSDSPLYAYALYKSAWCLLNPTSGAEPQYERSLDRFVKTIAATLEGRAGSEANARQIRREARRDLVLAFVHAGRPSRAWELFEKVGQGPKTEEDMARTMMEILASQYFGEGMYVESTAIYRDLQARFEGDAQVCHWQSRIVLNALATDDAEIQWKETTRLADTWDATKDGSTAELEKRRCRDATRDTLAQMATTWHDEATKTGKDRTWDLAGEAYAAFLRRFPKDKAAYDMAYWAAEVHWARAERLYAEKDRKRKVEGLAEFRAAHEGFLRVLKMKPAGRLTKDAAYAQMLAMKNALEYDETAGKRQSCRPQSDGTCVYPTARRERVAAREDASVDAAARFPKKEYGEAETQMLQAYATYEKFVKDPADPELPKILWHRAKIMMDHHRFEEAVPVLERLVDRFDGTRYAAWSAEMLLDVLTIRWADAENTPKDTIAASKRLATWAQKLEKKKLWRHEDAARIREQVPQLLAAIGWREAEAHRIAAKAGDDPDGYDKCAEKYVAIYEAHEGHDRGDELLFNAALCFEAGYRVGNAINVRKALLEHHPGSKLYKETLRAVAESYQAIAFYEQSAERLEEYAQKYERDEWAAPALENAFLFRRGLGDDEKATANLRRYEEVFQKKDAGKAAGIFWAEHDLLADDAAKLRHAEAYIERYGKKGGSDRLAVAHAAAGQVLWRRSCGKKTEGDVCVTITRRQATAGQGTRDQAEDLRRRNKKKIPDRCGSESQAIVTVHARDAKLAAAAQKHFEAAIEHAKKAAGPADDDRAAALRDATAMAMVYRADAKYESYLRLQMPEKLELYVESWKKGSGVAKWEREVEKQEKAFAASKARFEAFLAEKKGLGRELVEAYAKVKDVGSPHWILAGAARSAVLSQNFADQLYRADVPGEIKTEDQYDAYCDALSDYAEPLEKTALQAFEYCLERSTEYAYFNEFSRLCEEEMQQRAPERYPATNEMFGRSVYTASRMDRVPVQRTIPDGEKR
jgi:TolA-binding protein